MTDGITSVTAVTFLIVRASGIADLGELPLMSPIRKIASGDDAVDTI